MTMQAEYEAASARYSAIYRKASDLHRMLESFSQQIEDEYAAANAQLATVQSQPGIPVQLEGEPMSYEQVNDLEQAAIKRLESVFPWSVQLEAASLPGFSAHAQAGVEAIEEASK